MRTEFLLDADETILDFVRTSKECLKKALEKAGIECREYYFDEYKKANDQIWREYERGEITKQLLMTERFNRFFAAVGITADAHKINDLYFSAICKTGYLLGGADKFLSELKKRGKIYLITNGTPAAQYGRLDALGIRDIFDGIFISDEIGYAKPDKRFFEYVLNKTGLTQKQCFVIGDSLTSDVAGARNAGIDCIYYNPTKKTENAPQVFYEAHTYQEILDCIDNEKP